MDKFWPLLHALVIIISQSSDSRQMSLIEKPILGSQTIQRKVEAKRNLTNERKRAEKSREVGRKKRSDEGEPRHQLTLTTSQTIRSWETREGETGDILEKVKQFNIYYCNLQSCFIFATNVSIEISVLFYSLVDRNETNNQ